MKTSEQSLSGTNRFSKLTLFFSLTTLEMHLFADQAIEA